MIKVNLYNQKGESLKSTAALNPEIFKVGANKELMAQYIRVYEHNQRQGTSKTKNRKEVSGGGKKPWRQKGTGRARHGSIRSPLWVGGGTVFGPHPKDWSLRMPKKMRRRAMFSALSAKAEEDNLFVLNKISLEEIKTKKMVEIVSSFPAEGKILLVLPEENKTVYLSARNLQNVRVVAARNLNAYEVLSADFVLMVKDSLEVLENTFLKNNL